MEFNKIEFENYIKSKNIEYELLEHDILIRSAKDGAKYFKIDIGQTAAALILVVDEKLHGIILSGKTGRLDMDNIANILKAKNVKMAAKERIENDLNMPVGCVPMINLPIPCLIDKELLNYDYIYGGTGDKNLTIKLKPEALVKLNKKAFVYKLK